MNFEFFFNNLPGLTVSGLAFGAIYALIALGYTMVYGVLQLINFAHSEVFMYGTFAMLWTVMALGGADASGVQLVLILLASLVAAMLMSAAIALILERVAYRPLIKRNAPRLIALISAIGASFVLAELMGLRDRVAGWFGLDDDLSAYVGKARINNSIADVVNAPRWEIGGVNVSSIDILVICSAVGMMVVVDQFVRRSKLGKGIRATAQDAETASMMGVNPTRTIQMTFLIGGLMAGVAAFLYMLKIETTKFDMGFLLGVKAFTAAVLGGIGNLRGALLGGLVLGVAENWGAALLGTEWRHVVAFVLLVVILLVRPTGLLGESLGKARA
ncbi:branched-chain amino acid ABC transporter permease [Nocardioides sp. zg-1228]|uniref:branched-chain amino acid ABC transporter permease n=1 Tax=Nocardioides sp. zg-1228 TaxID=2763008 RepID=UPI00164281E2|nr:branched-chain amino acid ABC transporter permease [Nocardioides sp. zg-1228]MBC2934416.1 branched-chain amino acid ABC transporter permease [Nocardioides sp. zg-1228]QSF59183.1 branched-chain amino acid ABC transporter permease [Nocardioides sp. zg-1228]